MDEIMNRWDDWWVDEGETVMKWSLKCEHDEHDDFKNMYDSKWWVTDDLYSTIWHSLQDVFI